MRLKLAIKQWGKELLAFTATQKKGFIKNS
jgi:hypothetical protein